MDYKNLEPKEWLAFKDTYLANEQLKTLTAQAEAEEEDMLNGLSDSEIFDYMISKLNFCRRKQLYSNDTVWVSVGDICFIDFGMAYLQEAGYQHLGVVLATKNNKAFVVPMTSNGRTVRTAKSKKNPDGRDHVLSIGKVRGLNKPSALFLNDAKWINTSRIIDVKGHISTESGIFRHIREEVKRLI